jgi:hypothetical protein
MNWLLEPGTNKYAIMFLDNNSFLLLGLWGIVVTYLKHRARFTPSPEDDKLIEEVEKKVAGWFNAAVRKKG